MEKLKELETSHGRLLLSDFEGIFSAAKVMSYNKDFIEIPGVVIFTRVNSSKFINRVLNPGVEVIAIEEDLFQSMIEAITVHESDVNTISFESRTRPIKKTIINIQKIKDDFIFARINEDSITINDIIFTNNEAEYLGDGMFTAKKVYFVNFEQLATLRDIISE